MLFKVVASKMPIILDPKILKIHHDLTKLEVPQKWCPSVIFLQKYFSIFSKNARDFRTRFSHAIFAHDFLTRFLHAIFARNFYTRFSHAIFARDFCTRFSHAIFARETKSALKWSNLDGFSKFLNLNRSKFNSLQLYF